MLAAESTFRDLIDQTEKAQRALEKAFRHNPRQDWLAVRLARRYAEASNWSDAKKVLEATLQDNPSSKPAHLESARVLTRTGGERALVLDHLRRSFSAGDNNYEAQFWYAREMFLQSRGPDSKALFDAIHDRAPGRFRTHSAAPAIDNQGLEERFSGAIERIEEGYAFVRITHFSDAVFASRNESEAAEWGRLRRDAPVTCGISFSRRGPRATNISRK